MGHDAVEGSGRSVRMSSRLASVVSYQGAAHHRPHLTPCPRMSCSRTCGHDFRGPWICNPWSRRPRWPPHTVPRGSKVRSAAPAPLPDRAPSSPNSIIPNIQIPGGQRGRQLRIFQLQRRLQAD